MLVLEDDKVNTLAEALAALERGWPNISSGKGIEPEDKGCLEALPALLGSSFVLLIAAGQS